MNKQTIFAFIAGAAVGSFVTWQGIKKYYEQLVQEEIESVKVSFAQREQAKQMAESLGYDGREAADREKAQRAKDKPDIAEYVAGIKKEGYHDYTQYSQKKPDQETEPVAADDSEEVEKPYVITPDEYGEFEDYNQISLLYYADGVLADHDGEIVDDVDGTVGTESLTTFGKYEEDSVFVRNDRLKCDFEILLDLDNYSDGAKKRPHHAEV